MKPKGSGGRAGRLNGGRKDDATYTKLYYNRSMILIQERFLLPTAYQEIFVDCQMLSIIFGSNYHDLLIPFNAHKTYKQQRQRTSRWTVMFMVTTYTYIVKFGIPCMAKSYNVL